MYCRRLCKVIALRIRPAADKHVEDRWDPFDGMLRIEIRVMLLVLLLARVMCSYVVTYPSLW